MLFTHPKSVLNLVLLLKPFYLYDMLILYYKFIFLQYFLKIFNKNISSKFDSDKKNRHRCHSVLSAITGSFFDAAFAGIKPPISVSIILKITSIIAFFVYNVTFNGMFPVK